MSSVTTPEVSSLATTSPTTKKQRKQKPARTREQVISSVLRKIVIDPDTNCWIWTGGRSTQYAYASVWLGNTTVLVHRLLFEAQNGTIPKTAPDNTRYEIHHDKESGCLGRASGCVNPKHMKQLSARQHGLITSMERQLGLQSPKPPRRARKPPVAAQAAEPVTDALIEAPLPPTTVPLQAISVTSDPQVYA